MDYSSEMDDSMHITVRCQHCNEHCTLADFERHRSMHFEEKHTPSNAEVTYTEEYMGPIHTGLPMCYLMLGIYFACR